MLSPGAYSIYSAALHAEWHAVTGSWEEVTLAEGTRAIVICPDRVAVWSAVLICAAPAIVPAARALQLLDHRARSRELGHWVGNTLDLMRAWICRANGDGPTGRADRLEHSSRGGAITPAGYLLCAGWRLSGQRLAIGGGSTSAPARRPGWRTPLQRGLDGGGDELRGLRVDDDVPAEQHAADDLPGMRRGVVRADGGLAHTRD
jgi:hypothetical protein